MTRTRSSPFFDRIILWSFDHPIPPVPRYLATTLAIVAIAAVRATLITSLLPWLLFIPAILLIVLALGEGVGLYASLLSMILAALSIGRAGEPWFLTGAQWAASALYLAIAVGITLLTAEVRAAFHRTRQMNVHLAEREAFLSEVLASSTDCIKVLDLDGRLTFMSEGGMKVMEVVDFNAVKGCPWPDFWQDRGNIDACDAIAAAREGRPSHFIGRAETFLGNARWWDVSVSPILGPDGKPDRILSVSRDNTALMAAQEQQVLLNNELSHRLKNMLAIVQSVANQTFRQAETLESASAAFASRLSALGKATDILTATSWKKATMRDIATAGLTSVDGMAERVEVVGPHVELESQVALALTLALHELTTNACKYGALSNETGTVTLTWDHVAGDNPGDDRFNLLWREAGGPEVVAPTRMGFGARMIDRSLRSYFRGETALVFDPAGVMFRIDAPLPAIRETVGE